VLVVVLPICDNCLGVVEPAMTIFAQVSGFVEFFNTVRELARTCALQILLLQELLISEAFRVDVYLCHGGSIS
jgi:hypothetical protein